jgi:toxin-antitoxin system PIN domain toxin
MDFLDVNVLVNAFRRDAQRHKEFAAFVTAMVDGDQPFAIPAVVFSSFFRIVTHPKIFKHPSEFKDARVFAEQLHDSAQCLIVVPGPKHWPIFLDLCERGRARGAMVADAYLAAMAVEIGAELVTDDRGMGRWPGLRWRHPIDR